MMQRFSLGVWPDTSPEWVNVDRYPNSEARNTAYEIFDRLNTLDPAAVGAVADKYEDIPCLRFTPEARDKFNTWHEALELRVRGSELEPALESHLSKYRGLIPRLSLITHLIDEGKGPIGEMALIKALLWAEYLEPHAVRIYSAGVQPARAAAKTLLARIRAGHLQERPAFTTRDAYRNGWSGLTNHDQAQAAIDLLCAHAWLWAHHYVAGGREVVEYFIHPRLKHDAAAG
jgi:hypothetical protein